MSFEYPELIKEIAEELKTHVLVIIQLTLDFKYKY